MLCSGAQGSVQAGAKCHLARTSELLTCTCASPRAHARSLQQPTPLVLQRAGPDANKLLWKARMNAPSPAQQRDAAAFRQVLCSGLSRAMWQ